MVTRENFYCPATGTIRLDVCDKDLNVLAVSHLPMSPNTFVDQGCSLTLEPPYYEPWMIDNYPVDESLDLTIKKVRFPTLRARRP